MITEIVIERLPQKQIKIIEPYKQKLINIFCLIPDFEKKDSNSSIGICTIFLDSYDLTDVPESRERILLHAADRAETNYKIYEYYCKIIYEKFSAEDTLEAIKYLGTFLHFIEDTGSPAHCRYCSYDYPRGEKEEQLSHLGSLRIFKKLMFVPEKYKNTSMHGIIDQGALAKLN